MDWCQTCILTIFYCLFCSRMKVSTFQVMVAMEGMEEMAEILITAQLMHLFRVYWKTKFHNMNNIWADNPHRPKIRLQKWQWVIVSFFKYRNGYHFLNSNKLSCKNICEQSVFYHSIVAKLFFCNVCFGIAKMIISILMHL